MVVGNIKDLESKEVNHPSAKNTTIKVLIGEQQGWESHVMRILDVEVGGYTPKHSHPWPHINYMIEGKGEVMIDGKTYPLEKGSYSYVPSDTIHQFKNTGDTVFKFMCIVPKEGHK